MFLKNLSQTSNPEFKVDPVRKVRQGIKSLPCLKGVFNLWQATGHFSNGVETTPSKSSEQGTLKLFEDILNSGLSLRVKVTGRSMSPFLRGGEILTIRKVSHSSLQTGDLIFFKNHLGFHLLHRIVKKKRDNNGMFAFQTKGDALRVCDESVRYDKILGKVCKIEKINSVACTKNINMESTPWRTINYLIAMAYLFESRLYSIFKMLYLKCKEA
jgi:signal peptidase I